MKKSIILSILCILTAFLIQPIKAQKLSPQQKESTIKEVEAAFEVMLGYAEKLDYNKLSSGVDDTRKAGFIINNKYYPEYASLITDLNVNKQGVSKQEITLKEKKTTVLSGKFVLMTVAGVSNAELIDGGTFSANFFWSFVYEKIDGSWKVIHSHQSIKQ